MRIQDLYVGPFPLFIINASYARARAHTRPHTPTQGDPLVQTDRAPHTEHSRGGDRPCRPRPVRNVVRCESFLKVSGSVLLSDTPPPQREAQTQLRKVNVRDVSGNVSSKVSGVVKTVFSPNKKNKRIFFFFTTNKKE
jgi:hypothetical protein